MTRNPVAVITGDMHFTPATLELATQAFNVAVACAKTHGVPLILNGDTLDTKSIIRAEVANRLLRLLEKAKKEGVSVIINTGNHDLLNERSLEPAINFLSPLAHVVSGDPHRLHRVGTIIPYQPDKERLLSILGAERLADSRLLIVHQGVQTAFMGHYTQDKSSLPPEAFAGFRVIGSHYHRRQDITCGKGLFSYLGNPYTLSFGEAHDPDKGFSVLMDDGSLLFVPTNLRKHVILELRVDCTDSTDVGIVNSGDVVWVKLSGTRSELAGVDKKAFGEELFGHSDYKLDKIALDAPKSAKRPNSRPYSEPEALDSIIDETNEPEEQKAELKALWREALSENS